MADAERRNARDFANRANGTHERNGDAPGHRRHAAEPREIVRQGDPESPSGGIADVLMHRLFAVGLDLHSALTYIEAHVAEHTAVRKIHCAIEGLDDTIRDFRGVVFDLHQGRPAPGRPGSLRALVVQAVERACEPARGPCPGITIGSGIDAVTDETTSQQVARLVHRVLALVPGDHLPSAHVGITVDPAAPDRLIVRIDASVNGLIDVAEQVGTMGGRHIDVTCSAVPGSPAGSRIRVECRTRDTVRTPRPVSRPGSHGVPG